jgi:hypothetical protein
MRFVSGRSNEITLSKYTLLLMADENLPPPLLHTAAAVFHTGPPRRSAFWRSLFLSAPTPLTHGIPSRPAGLPRPKRGSKNAVLPTLPIAVVLTAPPLPSLPKPLAGAQTITARILFGF